MRLLWILPLNGDCLLTLHILYIVTDEVAHGNLLIEYNFIASFKRFNYSTVNKLMMVVDLLIIVNNAGDFSQGEPSVFIPSEKLRCDKLSDVLHFTTSGG